MASKKASGRNVAESERNTAAVKLRLDPETAEDLKDFADEAHTTRAKVVDAAMTLIYRLNEGDLSQATGQQVYEAFLETLGGPVVQQRARDKRTMTACAEIVAKRS